MENQVDVSGVKLDFRGLALESVRALVIQISVVEAVFGPQLRDLRIDDDLRMVRQVLQRVTA